MGLKLSLHSNRYAGPFATISYLYVRVSRELQTQQTSLAVVVFEPRGRSRTDSHSTTDYRPSRAESDICSQNSRSSYRDRLHQRHHIIDDNDLDIPKEKRTQKYLFSMVTVYAVCLCPLMILRLARLALLETYDNAGHFDITYTMFVWVAFVPTVTTPILFACWQMSRCAKDRLRGYFRFSNRKLRQSCETVISTTGTPATARAVHLNKGHNISDDMQSDDTNSRETTYGYQQEMSSS